MAKKMKFKIVKRDNEFCMHDTGVGHPVTMSCELAEELAGALGMREDHPDHDKLWHDD